MGFSNLCSYLDKGSENYNPRTAKISKITIHHAAGVVTVESMSKIMRTPGRTVSWNYAIGNDGRIGGYIDEKYRAWTTSSRENDNVAITIEVSNSMNREPWSISEAAFKSLLNLCEDICRRNNIRRINFTGNKSGNLTMHKWFASTGCPGPSLGSNFGYIANEINRRLGQESKLEFEYVTFPETQNVSAAGAAITGSTTPIIDLIDYKQINPYAATVDMTVQDIDIKPLRDAGVTFICIEAGLLYDSAHMEISRFRNPNLDKIIKRCKDANMPYALYVEISGRTFDEINKEIYHIRLAVQKYVPPIGLWISPNFRKDRIADNDEILKRYYDAFVKMGLRGKVGLYCTKEMLTRITWKGKWCDVFHFWMNEHISSFDEVDMLLNPEFFMNR